MAAGELPARPVDPPQHLLPVLPVRHVLTGQGLGEGKPARDRIVPVSLDLLLRRPEKMQYLPERSRQNESLKGAVGGDTACGVRNALVQNEAWFPGRHELRTPGLGSEVPDPDGQKLPPSAATVITNPEPVGPGEEASTAPLDHLDAEGRVVDSESLQDERGISLRPGHRTEPEPLGKALDMRLDHDLPGLGELHRGEVEREAEPVLADGVKIDPVSLDPVTAGAVDAAAHAQDPDTRTVSTTRSRLESKPVSE